MTLKKKKILSPKNEDGRRGKGKKKKKTSNTSVKYLLILLPYLTKDSLKNAWNKSKFVSLFDIFCTADNFHSLNTNWMTMSERRIFFSLVLKRGIKIIGNLSLLEFYIKLPVLHTWLHTLMV